MTHDAAAALNDVLQQEDGVLLPSWIDQQIAAPGYRADRWSRTDLADHSRRFLTALRDAVATGEADVQSRAWQAVRDFLDDLSRARAQQGFSAAETATFVFSLKQALFDRFRTRLATRPELLAATTLHTSLLLDRLGLLTTEQYQRGREQLIIRQQQELLELSTPVVALWDGVLALPLIGTLDSARTQVVMENLLQRIVDTGALIAIIDITGVPTVDTLTAQHLLKTVAAARLMGADCIISGIRPQIAQTIVHLGVNLGDVVTKSSLADALTVALRRTGFVVSRGVAEAAAR